LNDWRLLDYWILGSQKRAPPSLGFSTARKEAELEAQRHRTEVAHLSRAPRADSAKRRCAISRRRFNQMAKWIAASVKHTADAIDQTTVIQLTGPKGLKRWQEANW